MGSNNIYLIFFFTLICVAIVNGLLDIPCNDVDSSSSLWEESHLEPCEGGMNLFIEDPWSKSLLHTCDETNSNSNSISNDDIKIPSKLAALPSTCNDIRFRSLAIDNNHNHIYVSSTYAILRSNLTSSSSSSINKKDKIQNKLNPNKNIESIIGGYVIIHIDGYNFNKDINKMIIKIKNIQCDTLFYSDDENENEKYNRLTCIIGNPKVTSSLIDNNDITISILGITSSLQSIRGLLTYENAFSKYKSGYQQPLIYNITINDKGFKPGAITIYPGKSSDSNSDDSSNSNNINDENEGRLYWYNRASQSIQSSNLYGTNLKEHITNLGRVSDIKIDSSGKWLFVSNQHLRNIMIYDVSSTSTSQQGSSTMVPSSSSSQKGHVLIENIYEPWGIALDELNGLIFIAESGKGNILRYDGLKGYMHKLNKLSMMKTTTEDDDNVIDYSSLKTLTKSRIIVSVNANIQLTDLSLFGQGDIKSKSSSSSSFNMKPSLMWNEANGDKVKISTLYGTRIENIISKNPTITSSNTRRENTLIWPRAIIGDTRQGYGNVIYVAEFLGKIWELKMNDSKYIKLIVDLSNLEDMKEEELGNNQLIAPSSSANLREFLGNIWKNGANSQTRTGAFLRLTA